MHRSLHIRPSPVDSAVNHEAGGIDRMHVATFTFLDLTVFVNEDEVRRRHVTERLGMWVDPEAIWADGIADCNMPTSALLRT